MRRQLLIATGFVAVLLGAAGAILPVLPTTPFLLLAAACFARSSERWHGWLLGNRFSGPLIRDWEERRCITAATKTVAITSMFIVGGLSVWLALEQTPHRIITLGLMTVGAVVVLSLPTCRPDSFTEHTHEPGNPSN